MRAALTLSVVLALSATGCGTIAAHQLGLSPRKSAVVQLSTAVVAAGVMALAYKYPADGGSCNNYDLSDSPDERRFGGCGGSVLAASLFMIPSGSVDLWGAVRGLVTNEHWIKPAAKKPAAVPGVVTLDVRPSGACETVFLSIADAGDPEWRDWVTHEASCIDQQALLVDIAPGRYAMCMETADCVTVRVPEHPATQVFQFNNVTR